MDKQALYCLQYTTTQHTLLQEVEAYTLQHHAKAHMLSGPLQGQLLILLSKLLMPKYILEIGTFTGYSALCLAEGLQSNGELHTLENRPEDAQIAQQFINKSVYKNQIQIHEGNAIETLAKLQRPWDIVFIDADKTGYINYYELLLPVLPSGAFIIADNVLFHNEVLEVPIKGKNAIAIDAFNKHVLNDERTEQVLLPVRDGLSLIRKK
jgi:caffeoyl-CoA O-methyltransferase